MSQNEVDGFVARVYQQQGQTMPYRLFIPPRYEKSRKYPVIVWLHGGGGTGTDNLRQIQKDQVPGTRIWTTAANQTKHPAFVVVPQTTTGWDMTGSSAPNADRPDERQLTSALVQVLGILDALKMEFPIDSNRLYVAGQSIGGFGTWNLITKKPGVFAAAIILSGGGNADLAGNVKDMPIWSFQGDADGPAFLNSNRNMIAAVRKAGGKPRYTEYPGMRHEIWDRVFKEPDLVEWLFAQHK
jgi:predicted peptidase